MTVNDFHQEMKDYGNELLAKYGLADCIMTCGQFRANKNLTFCLKFRTDTQKARCNFGSDRKDSIQIISSLTLLEPILAVRKDDKFSPFSNYVKGDEQAYLNRAKLELKALLAGKLNEDKFWGQLIVLKKKP